MPDLPGQQPSRTIIIADDHPFVCEALARLVAYQLPLTRTVTARTFNELLEKAEQTVSVVGFCIDYLMPGFGNPSKLSALRQSHPHSAILIISAVEDQAIEAELIAAGADAFLSKSLECDALADQLIDHIRKYGEKAASDAESDISTHQPDLPCDLTPSEAATLATLCEGLSNKEIAAKHGLAEQTIKMHLTSIYQKLGVENRSAAIAKSIAWAGRQRHG